MLATAVDGTPTLNLVNRVMFPEPSTPLENLGQYDCVMILTDHSDYDYQRIVDESQLVVDTRNATKGIKSPKVVRC